MRMMDSVDSAAAFFAMTVLHSITNAVKANGVPKHSNLLVRR